MEEIWKDVAGYEGSYQVSNLGRVKSLSRQMFNGVAYFISKEKILKIANDRKGYPTVVLCKYSITKTKRVHQIMAESFFNYSYKESGLVINHKDFNRTNNLIDNLEIVTTRENTNQKHIPHTSKYTGVCFYGIKNKWQSAITYKGKIIYLGRFDSEEEASLYYENALKAIELGNEIIVKTRKKSSKYKGVSFNKQSGKWVSFLTINGITKQIGYFPTEIEAAAAVASARQKLTSSPE